MSEDGPVNQVPDVVGFDAIDACEMVRAAGLAPHGPQLETPPDTGTIVAQKPEPSTNVEPDSPVELWTEDRRAAGDRVPDPTDATEPA